MNIVSILSILLLLTFPFGVIFRIPITSSIAFYPADILLFVLFIVNSVLLIKKKDIFKLSFFIPLVCFILICTISLLLNFYYLNFDYLLNAFLYIVRFVLYAQLIYVFQNTSVRFARLYIGGLMTVGSISLLFGFIQYYFYYDLRNLYYLGWDEHLFRIFSTFLDPNFAGMIFVLLFILSLGIFQKYSKRNSYIQLSLSIAMLLTVFGIFLTYSRSTYIALVCGVIAYLFAIKKTKFIIIALILIAAGIIVIPKKDNIEGMRLFRTASISSRFIADKAAVNIFMKSPIYGVGFNAYRYAQRHFGYLNTDKWEESHSGAGVSNSYLFVLATTGIVGFTVFMFFWFKVVKNVIVVLHENKKNVYISASVFASLVAVFTHSLFENTLFYPFIMLWIYSLVGSWIRIVDEKKQL